MRLTRAASRAEAADTDDASSPHAPQDSQDRVPLGDRSPNTPLEPEFIDAPTKKKASKKSKAKGGAKKGAKGKTAGEEADVADEPTADHVQAPMNDQRPPSPPSRAGRRTRRQLALQEEELSSSLQSHGPPQPERTGEDTTAAAQEELNVHMEEEPIVTTQEEASVEPEVEPVTRTQEESNVQLQEEPIVEARENPVPECEMPVIEPQPELVVRVEQALAVASQEAAENIGSREQDYTSMATTEPADGSPSVEVTQLEPKTLTSEKPCEEEVTPATSFAPSRAISRDSSRSPSKTPMCLEESIGAIDALEEALEDVGKALPTFHQLADDKSPRKAKFTENATPKSQRKTAERPSVAFKISRNPSIAPKSLKPTGLSRSSSVRAPPKDRTGSGEVTDYLASKRRPISMTFAAPPPPAKSTKPPTRPTFQLPGEAIAAKLKAQKEERLKREAEEGPVKRRPISMPPPPKSTKPPTKPSFQLPGEAIAAKLKAQKEERLKREAEGEEAAPRQVSGPVRPKSSKPPTVPKFQLPGEAIAAKLKAQKEERMKREEEAEATRKAAFKARPAPARRSVAAPIRQSTASQARGGVLSKENIAGPSIPPLQKSNSTSARRSHIGEARCVTGPVNRGREVFNRDKLDKEARDQSRREKEDAARKARAEAAERGRIASREWAEKQKKKAEGSRT